MNANYLSDSSKATSASAFGTRSMLKVIITTALASVILLVSLLSAFTQSQKTLAEDESTDPVQWVMCFWGDDSIPAGIYQATQSSDVQFQTMSKSTMNFGTDRIDNGLNGILEIFGPSFVDVNKEVIGRETNAEYESEESTSDEDEEEVEFNSGEKVNPFDRFGVAGLKFTGYTGEWKHVIIDACDPSKEPIDPEAGMYYDGRLEPQSTWEDIDQSQDARTQQFAKGFFSHYGQAIGNLTANWVFIIPKTFVVVTVGLINFSFADVGEKLGVVDLLVGENGDDGVFTTVFDNFYVPLLALIFLIVGLWILGVGMVQRRVREAFGGLARAIVMIFVAFVIAANPAPFVNAPNTIAVTFQSIILDSMNRSLESQGELCNTDIGSITTDIDTSDSDDDQESLAEASDNIRSVVGCTFWQMFLVTPWAEAQYGTDWNQLWVKDQVPDWAPEDAGTLQNTNDEMVGDAAVPIGGGEFINNWAIFQISAQTDAHSPLGDDGAIPKYSNGVSTDWWRIVDAFSNYQETKVNVEGGAIKNDSGGSGSTEGGWGGHENGKIPEDELANVEFDNSHKLREDAVEKLSELNEAYKEQFGQDISITDSYRSYEEQVDIKERKPDLAAEPGTSNHGWGLALDLGGGINNFGTEEHEWMVQNAEEYGWILPDWAQENGSKPEAWHWEFTGEYSGGGSGGEQESRENATDADEEGAYWAPDTSDEAQPVDEWDTWAGNSAWSRVAGASSAALIAGVGLLAPFILSLMASSAALGSVLLMAFAPVMLLLGSGPSGLFEVFKGWLKLLVDVVLTRIAVGILLVLSIIFTMIAIGTISDVGWWQGMILLVLGSLLLIKSRHKFVSMLTAMSFSARDFSGGMNRMSNAVKTAGKTGVRTVATSAAGGVNSKRYGGSFSKGAFAGAKNELKNQAYRTKTSRSVLATYETMKHNTGRGEDLSQKNCARCGREIADQGETARIAGRDDAGNYYCRECLEDGATPEGTQEVVLDDTAKTTKRKTKADKKPGADEDKKKARFSKNSAYTSTWSNERREEILEDEDLSDKAREAKFVQMAKGISFDIRKYDEALLQGSEALAMPAIPTEIEAYLDRALIERAWSEQNYDYVQAAYTVAWATWFQEETGQQLSTSIQSLVGEVTASTEYARSMDSTQSEDTLPERVEDAEKEGKKNADKEAE